MSVLGSESGLMSSFLSSEEIGELLDKVQNMLVFTFYKYVDPEYFPPLPYSFQNIWLINFTDTVAMHVCNITDGVNWWKLSKNAYFTSN